MTRNYGRAGKARKSQRPGFLLTTINHAGYPLSIQAMIAVALWAASLTGTQAQAPTAPVKSHLQLWLSADSGITTNASGGVTGWKDQSGQNNNATQITNSAAPRWVGGALNGKPVIRFDGTSQYLNVADAPSIEISGDISTFAVVKFDDYSNYREIWGKTVANQPGPNDWYLVQNSGISRVYRGDGAGANGSVDSSAPIAAGQYLSLGWSMAATNVTQYLNGYPDGSGVISATVADGGTDLKIGSRDDLGTQMKGDIAEILIYDTALTKSDLEQVFDYLIAKYGLFGPAGGFISISPAPNSINAVPNSIQIVHRDGVVPWAATNVTMTVDGAPATLTFTRDGSFVTASYSPSPIYAPYSAHSVSLTYPDGTGKTTSTSWDFWVAGYSKDTVQGYVGLIKGPGGYTADKGGHTGQAGDYAIDSTPGGRTWVDIINTTYVGAAAAKDVLSVSVWVKKYDIAAGSAFWMNAPDQPRADQSHIPWSNDTIYYDTGGTAATCCDGSLNRISAAIDTFPAYVDDSFWTNWHHFTYTKNQENKNIYIDGTLFLNGTSTAPLSALINEIGLFTDGVPGADYMHGLIDDFAVFSTEISAADAAKLATGTSPKALTGETLIAFWDFNDAVPAAAYIKTVLPTLGATNASPVGPVQVVLVDGPTAIATNTITLKLDGAAVTPSISKTGSVTTVTYKPASVFASASSHTAVIGYTEGGNPVSRTWQFTVSTYVTTKDSVAGYLGLIRGGPGGFTPDAGGHTGQAGDYAVDSTNSGGTWVDIPDVSFLNTAAPADKLSMAFWLKRYDVGNGSAFWAQLTQVQTGTDLRGFQAHVPWGNDTIYFDTEGCCDGSLQRISANINSFPGWSDDSFWTNWHHFVFTKNAADKNIYIDGQLFLNGASADPLQPYFAEMGLLTDGTPGGDFMHGLIDDFAVFSTEVSAADAAKLAAGASPKDLTGETLIAFWDFNDANAGGGGGIHISGITSGGGNVTITWTGGGTLQTTSKLQNTGTVWTDVTGKTSPAQVPATGAASYFRIKQ